MEYKFNEFCILEVEYANRHLPTIAYISILLIENGEVKEEFSTHIYNEEEQDDYMKEKNNISRELLLAAPRLEDVWVKIYNLLSERVVITHKGKRVINLLFDAAAKRRLALPSLIYYSIESLFRINFDYKRVGEFSTSKAIKLYQFDIEAHYTNDVYVLLEILLLNGLASYNYSPIHMYTALKRRGGYYIEGIFGGSFSIKNKES